MRESRRVVVTGIGVLTPLADSPGALHEALCEGRTAVAPVEMFDTATLRCRHAGELRGFAPKKYLQGNIRPLDRTSRLSAIAAQLALEAGGCDEEWRSREEVGLVLGTMFGSVHVISAFDRRAVTAGPIYAKPMDFANSVLNAAAGQTAIRHNLRGLNSTISGGTTSGVKSLAYASDMIRSGRTDMLLAGGADELCHESFHGFQQAGMLCGAEGDEPTYPVPFDARRNGFVPAEGAAFLLLEDAEAARKRGARALAEIRGYSSCHDGSRGQDDARAEGAVNRAIRLALKAADTTADAVDLVSASANGGPRLDRQEARGLHAALNGAGASTPVIAIKAMLGEALGASGTLQTIAAIEAMRTGHLPGVRRLEGVADDIPLEGILRETEQHTVRQALVTAVGLHSGASALVIARPDAS